ncbi:MAG: hypothetical protein AABX70_06765 [Nanoarchaeota archaeon]
MQKRAISLRGAVILIVTALFLLTSSFAQAQTIGGGCCFDAGTGECITVPSQLLPDADACRATSGSAFVANDCPSLSQCNLGCCCFSDGQTQSTTPAPLWSCQSGATKQETTANANCNDICSVPAQTFTVEGKVSNKTDSQTLPLQGASVNAPNLNKQDTTDSVGAYILRNIPANTLQEFIASFPGCKNDNKTLNVTNDITALNFELDCTCTPNEQCGSFLTAPCVNGIQTVQCQDLSNCRVPPTFNKTQSCQGICTADTINHVIISNILAKARKARFTIDWSYDSSCKGQENIKNTVMRCNAEQTNCVALGETTRTHFEDNGTAPNAILSKTTYCYQIQSQFFDASTKNSEFKCVTSGDAQCLTQTGSEFCQNNSRANCNNQNELHIIENCGNNKFCLGPFPPNTEKAGQTQCVDTGACNKCNGLFEEMSYLDYLNAFVGFGSDKELKKCFNDDPNDLGLVQQHICYLDTSSTIVDKYFSCSQVKRCSNYHSEKTCILNETKDPCFKNIECQWLKPYGEEASTQLGLGTCQSTTPTHEDCQSCSELLGGCTQANCELISSGRGKNCYFDGDPNGLDSTKGCAGKEKIICRDYDTQNECEGGQAVSVNAQYDANKTRIGGNNQLTPSQDLLGFGKCFFDANNNLCDRNADGLSDKDCTSLTDFTCQKDFEAPLTQLNIPLSPITQRAVFNKEVSIDVNVNDNSYASNLILTSYCITPQNQTCYPSTNLLNTGGKIQEIINTTGRYKIFYYSADPAKNIEVVAQSNIEVDLDAPIITLDSVDNTTNETQLNVAGHVTSDTTQLCVENKNLPGTKRCIVPCSVDPGQNPGECIGNDLTFNFLLPLTGPRSQETINEIIFTAKDEVNNVAEVTLGFLLDLQGPGPVTGTLE